MEKGRFSRILSTVGFPAVIIATVAAALLFREELALVFASPARLRQWVDQWGWVSPIVFIGLQILQVIVFIIPGEVPQIAGGYLFDVVPGLVYSLAGITIGSAFNYGVAKLLGVPFVERVFSRSRLERFEHVIKSPKAIDVFFLLFLIPGIPMDILCYVAGLSRLRFGAFLMISMAGRLPGILGSVLIGSAAADQRWIMSGIFLLVAVLFFLAGVLFRDRLFRFVVSLSRRSRRKAGVPIDERAAGPDEASPES